LQFYYIKDKIRLHVTPTVNRHLEYVIIQALRLFKIVVFDDVF
jgi:hypothetical protein